MLGKLGLIVIWIGFALVLIAVMLATLAVVLETEKREKGIQPEIGFAGCILLFFIPVCFAAGSLNAVQVILLIAIISVLVILLITLSLFFLLPLIRWIKLKNFGKAS